ncbi:electron transfer flavoprotein subunit beta/FixA family protein [Arthrobacter sp. efr-133-R2A-120]|uniref:electron transfer flavoprotein subunit beta/FixA family protein n=1 Tax=Arthrobacter sp. efr-133-R2A-120 TaxID=3040277 RepID=UPI00254C4C53|nr:electron transfer flavoprotein subunit beta/FixA family protein [Arthrobacter sp. efr-133-R2A-120]
MKIVVLAKEVPDTEEERVLDLQTGLLDRVASDRIPDEINERALEVALRFKDENKDAEVVVLCVGPAQSTKSLRKLLSMGADSAIHVADDGLAGADASATSAALAAALSWTGYDLVVAGNESTDGRGGVVPAMVAERLGLPLLPSLGTATITSSSVSGLVGVEGGTLSVSADLPAVISVTESAAEARFPNFKGILKAKKKPLQTLGLSDLGVGSFSPTRSVMVSANGRPPRAMGRKVVDEGNAAAELADFLVAGRLI